MNLNTNFLTFKKWNHKPLLLKNLYFPEIHMLTTSVDYDIVLPGFKETIAVDSRYPLVDLMD